jgi:hypothetical protein
MWGRARLGTGSVDRFGDPRASSEHILFLPARPDNQFASDADLDSGHAIYRSLQASGALRCVRPVGGSPRCEWRRQAGRCRRVWLLGSTTTRGDLPTTLLRFSRHQSEHIRLSAIVEVRLSPNDLIVSDLEGVKHVKHVIVATDEICPAFHNNDSTGLE